MHVLEPLRNVRPHGVRNAAIALGVVLMHGAVLWAVQRESDAKTPPEIIVPVTIVARLMGPQAEVSPAPAPAPESEPEQEPAAHGTPAPQPASEPTHDSQPVTHANPDPEPAPEPTRQPALRTDPISEPRRARQTLHPRPPAHPAPQRASRTASSPSPAVPRRPAPPQSHAVTAQARTATPLPAAAPAQAGAPATTAPAAPVTAPSASAAYLHNPPPPYPSVSRRLGESGRVVIRALIGADGRAQEARIVHSSGYSRLDQAALEAARDRWRYKPGTRGGVPEAMWFDIPINFVLD